MNLNFIMIQTAKADWIIIIFAKGVEYSKQIWRLFQQGKPAKKKYLNGTTMQKNTLLTSSIYVERMSPFGEVQTIPTPQG